ncbi:MAG: efflux RND transporter periplasmic adaptor subunit [Legionellaceae bacterium]|nr:efflux RND transporter periplasmic adaptor subunit [Legionellaceae bacterium]
MKTRKHYLILPVVLFLGVLALTVYLRNMDKKPLPSPPPLTVETTAVQQVMVAEQVETVGNLKSLNQINISSELAGQIKSIHFTPGSFVKKGTLLIELDDSILQSELAAAKASLALSQNNYTRITELAKRRISSAQAVDEALADFEDKQNQVAIKKAQLQKMKLVAPFSGVLGSRQISVGQYVTVGQGLVKLVANQKLRVEYRLPEHYLSDLAVGQQVTMVSDAYPGKVFHGLVNYVDPVVDEDTRSIAVEALIDNPKARLSPGLFVKVNHQFGRESARLLVPEESLIPTISGQKVFIYKDGKATLVSVEAGAHHAEMTEILRGLQVSDIIITRGQHKLKDGAPVIDIHQG